jgi:lipoprotein-anchoring transpeptidase ErfK/SrfK
LIHFDICIWHNKTASRRYILYRPYAKSLYIVRGIALKNVFRRITALLLSFTVLSGLISASAENADDNISTEYTDIADHWAEETFRKALGDSLIEGFQDKLHPDAYATTAELLTILCRIFSAETEADMSHITDVTKDDWFYASASKTLAMGIISPAGGRLGIQNILTRSKAITIIAEAFQLIPVDPDTTVLSDFKDGSRLSGKNRRAMAALVSAGYVEGYDGSLHIDDQITRAEVVSLLYRIISEYPDSAPAAGNYDASCILSGDTQLQDATFSGDVYFDSTSSNISFWNVSAGTVVLRSGTLSGFSMNSSGIERLVLASGSGDVRIYPAGSSHIDTVVVGSGTGKVTLGGNIADVEITGDGREVVLTGTIGSLRISGSSNSVIINEDVTVDSIDTGSGTGNALTVNGRVRVLEVAGAGAEVNGQGYAESVTQNTGDSEISLNAGTITENENYGLDGVSMTMTAPGNLPAGQPLKASAHITAPDKGKLCKGTWYIDDVFVTRSNITLSENTTASFSYDLNYTPDLPESAVLSFVLSYITEDGIYQELRTDHYLTLENYPDSYYDKAEQNRVLDLVTTGYKGDYTLKWAEANDYSAADKETWVNAKGYDSTTEYLVWVSIAYQRVNIFTGHAGNWKLDRTFIVGTGARGNDTPTGIWKIIGRHTRGWTTKDYTVKPVINFISSAYGFHSRLYKPNTTTISDARIGFPVSHGCIRMYTEDVEWFYDNIPTGTTVIVF